MILCQFRYDIKLSQVLQVQREQMQKTLDYDYIFKYILIGDAFVGKSALLNMFVNQTFISENNPTMGVEFATKKIAVDGNIIKVQIWDTAGQESFRTITRAYYKNAIGIILVYDLTSPNSLQSIDSWLQEIHDNSNEIVQIIIVGNKADLAHDPPVQMQKELPFIATSAKSGHNIKKVFISLTHTILQKIKSGKIDAQTVAGVKKGNLNPDNRVKLTKESKELQIEQKKCCG